MESVGNILTVNLNLYLFVYLLFEILNNICLQTVITMVVKCIAIAFPDSTEKSKKAFKKIFSFHDIL